MRLKQDGGIVSFRATHPKWSFAKVDEKGLVTEVAEKILSQILLQLVIIIGRKVLIL